MRGDVAGRYGAGRAAGVGFPTAGVYAAPGVSFATNR
jgi:hypothetical protein